MRGAATLQYLPDEGAVPVPVDTQADDEQLQSILEDAEVDYAFADETCASRLDSIDFGGRVFLLGGNEADPDSDAKLATDDDVELEVPAPDDVALLPVAEHGGAQGPGAADRGADRPLARALGTH